MKIGDEFTSYKQFEETLDSYKHSTCNEYWIRDARTIDNQRKRFPDTVDNVNESLKYYYLRLACIKGGRPFKPKNAKSSRKTTTAKQDCKATIFLRLTPCQSKLAVVELNDKHNHSSSKSYFNSLSKQRLNLPKKIRDQAKKSVKAGVNRKKVIDQIQQETGRKITLKDLSNISRRTEKNYFTECVELLKNTYNCSSIEVWARDDSNFKGLYFQDERMKKDFEAFPEVLFVSGTCSLADLKTATYVIMVENGNGIRDVVAVCLADDNEAALDFLIINFKEYNRSWKKIQLVLSDKERVEKKVFKKHFPSAKCMICLSQLFDNFNKDITVKKMNITPSAVINSKSFLRKLTYANSEHEYNTIYQDMLENIPEVVKQYYDTHWAPYTDLWVNYLTYESFCLSENTLNWLEDLNLKLKQVINKNSTVEDFIKHLFIYINNYRDTLDVRVSTVSSQLETSEEELYSDLLTKFAYKSVKRQLQFSETSINLKLMSDTTFMGISTEGLLKVTPNDCDCMFRKSNRLPCKHILKCRKLLSLPSFDSTLCLDRWTELYFEKVLQERRSNSHSLELSEELEKVTEEPEVNLSKSLTSEDKFKIIYDQGKTIAKLCSEVPASEFYKRYKLMENLIKTWSQEQ